MTVLTEFNVTEYARARNLVRRDEAPRIETLPGGVACQVLRLHTQRGPIVIKQAREKFQVQESWLVDPRRNELEAQFQTLARQSLGAERVPAVLDLDRENFCFTMVSAPLDAQNWKAMMLAGDVQPELGAQCGQLLRRLHAIPAPGFLKDKELFYQQRIEPYFEFTARRHPDMADELTKLSERLMAAEDAVTHGDFTPKNCLVAAGKLILLDYEVGHVGWPEFDVASMVNHLTLKFIHLSNPALLETARQFLDLMSPRAGWLECLGALMLARVDGKSPAEYLRDADKPLIRELAKQLLHGRFASYEEFQTRVF